MQTNFPSRQEILDAQGQDLRVMVANYLMKHPLPYHRAALGGPGSATDYFGADGRRLPWYGDDEVRAWVAMRHARSSVIIETTCRQGKETVARVEWSRKGCMGEVVQAPGASRAECLYKAALLSELSRLVADSISARGPQPAPRDVYDQSATPRVDKALASAPLSVCDISVSPPTITPQGASASERYRCSKGHEYQDKHEWQMGGESISFCPVCFLLLVNRECAPVRQTHPPQGATS